MYVYVSNQIGPLTPPPPVGTSGAYNWKMGARRMPSDDSGRARGHCVKYAGRPTVRQPLLVNMARTERMVA